MHLARLRRLEKQVDDDQAIIRMVERDGTRFFATNASGMLADVTGSRVAECRTRINFMRELIQAARRAAL